jgi:hypothetical protein
LPRQIKPQRDNAPLPQISTITPQNLLEMGHSRVFLVYLNPCAL